MATHGILTGARSLSVRPFADGSAHGFYPVETRAAMLQRHIWLTWVSGLWHHEAASEQFRPGRPLSLIPDPENVFDAAAVGVWDDNGSVQAGWIPHSFSTKMEPAERSARAMIDWQVADERVGLLILVSRTPVDLVIVEGPLLARVDRELHRWLRTCPQKPTEVSSMDPIEAMKRMLKGYS